MPARLDPGPAGLADVRPDSLYSLAQVGPLLGVCRDTLYRWVSTGRLKVVRLPTGAMRVTGEVVLQVAGRDAPPPKRETPAERAKRAAADFAAMLQGK